MDRISVGVVVVLVALTGCGDQKAPAFPKGSTMADLKAQSAKIEAENARREAEANPPPLKVSAAKLTRPWPFTVSEGSIVCLSGKRIIFRAGEKTYALNGLAREVATVNHWSAIEDIWKFESKGSQYRVSASELMALSTSHCRS